MSKTYTDAELLAIAQLAYCNLDSDYYKKLQQDSKDGTVGLRELFEYTLSKNGNVYEYFYSYRNLEDATEGDEKKMLDSATEMIDAIVRGEICQDWKILGI